ncbi:MAG: hypothetical protein LBB59_00825 [Campylobacteraceae bacterium]|jgi:hypothetical protein|nr:hypothetical protein [Campylobacteraceae bacterium]
MKFFILFFVVVGGIFVLLSGFIFNIYTALLLVLLYFTILAVLSKKIQKINEAERKISPNDEISYHNFADWSFFGKKIEVTAASSLDENDILSVLYEGKKHQAKLLWNVFGKEAREVKKGDILVIYLKTTFVSWENGKEVSESWFDVVRPEFADSIPIQAL